MNRVAIDKRENRADPWAVTPPANCLVCGGGSLELQLNKNGYDICGCTQCGFQFVAPMPDEEFLSRFYQELDYFQSDGSFGYSDYEARREIYLDSFRSHLRVLNGHSKGGRLLDLGCGNGEFLKLAREAGWEAYGVEMSESCRQEAERRAGVRVYSSVHDLPGQSGSFDVITLWEVIEHLPQPDKVVGEVLPLLQPGGLLALTTPNTRNLTAQRFPPQWAEYKPPEHLLYFDFKTIQQYLSTRFNLQMVEVKGIHRDLRLASCDWIESILGWALELRSRHETRLDPRWWVYAAFVRVLKEVPRRLSMTWGMLDPRLVDTGIFVLARK